MSLQSRPFVEDQRSSAVSLWHRWLRRRLPPADRVCFGRHNLFIFPAREGALFLALLIVMLLTGINYQNSLIYLLTFLLAALFYVGILQTHDNLTGVSLSLDELEEGFVGNRVHVALRVLADDDLPRPGLSLTTAEAELRVHLSGDAPEVVRLGFMPRHRGLNRIPRIRAETRYPMGLFRAWSYVWLRTPVLVYPTPVQPPQWEAAGRAGEDEIVRPGLGREQADDFSLRPYRLGDLSQRVLWKRYARDGQMVVLEPDNGSAEGVWLDFDSFADVDPERRLSYLTWLVEEYHRSGVAFGLRLPRFELPPASGSAHRKDALRHLALFTGGSH